jgi:hypothetical protein
MAYNLEKYREKREKVLGFRKRGLSFGAIALFVSLVIVGGLAVILIPKSIAFFHTRHLEDAIYRLNDEGSWSEKVLAEVRQMPGIRDVSADAHGARIVVTFNGSLTDTDRISTFFSTSGLQPVLLNTMGHHQRLHTIEKEASP